ncbi:MAG: hypothetical protein M3463_14995 [Verrucomicrobiota bacterium]|nr:hypothetical protein [Verrucomicrobiota bacterium]
MTSRRHPLAQVCLFFALSLSAVTNEVEHSSPAEPGAGSREVQFYAHTSRVDTPTPVPNGTVLAVYDHLGRLLGNTQEGWLSSEVEDYRLGFFRATLPGPGAYSFAITAESGQAYWTDLLDGDRNQWVPATLARSNSAGVFPQCRSAGELRLRAVDTHRSHREPIRGSRLTERGCACTSS